MKHSFINTQKILKRPPLVAIDSHSGLAGIAFWINAYFNLPDKKKIDKHDPVVVAIKEEIDKEYLEGRNTVISDEEILNIIARVDKPRYRKLMQHK